MKKKNLFIGLILTLLLSAFCLFSASCGTGGNGWTAHRGSGSGTEGGASDSGAETGDSGTETGDGKNADGNNDTSGSEGGQEIVYVPSFQSMTGAENGSCRNLEVNCGFLYYSVMESGADGQNRRRFYRQSLTKEGSLDPAQELYAESEAWEELTADTYAFFTDAKGYGYFILRKTGADTSHEQYFLCKYGVSGSELFRREITPEMTAQTENTNLFRRAVTDGESRIYIGQTEAVYLYDKEGNLQAKTPVPGELAGMDCGRDGSVYVTYRTNRELILGKVDFEKGTVEEIYSGFPGDGTLSGGTKYDVLTMDQQTVYGFSAGMEAPVTVLSWMDSDLYGDEIAYIHGMEDGKLLAVADIAGNESQLVFLAPPTADHRPEKEVLTIGVMEDQSSQDLDMLVTGFNRSSEHYRAELILYGQGSRDLNELTAALDRANMAIVTGDSPDLICLYRGVIVDRYVKKGILEDLTGYLESSSVIHREDLLAPALEQFTYGDRLYGMPRAVTLRTIVGRTSQVGGEMGWTIDEMKQFAHDHPEARLFDTCTKTQMLRILLEYNMKNYVDWLDGTCSFDSEEFRELLEFSNSFPLEQLPDEDLTLENGGILLYTPWDISHVSDYTYIRQDFGGGEITCIGYPGEYGCGTMLDVDRCAFGISALSGHKEGAWEFLEYMMTDDTLLTRDFPVNKALLERNFLDAMGQDYVYDAEGNIVLDEDGKPLVRELYTTKLGCWPVQEDVDAVRRLLEAAEPTNLSWGNIFNIINEEAAPYFYGQKTLDEVVDIIQRRAQLYVSE